MAKNLLVTDSFNQLRIQNGSKVEYYKYATIKSLSALSDADGNFSVVINFTSDDKNNPLLIKLDNVANQITWVDTALGVNVAIEDISDWMHTDNPSTNVTVEGWTAPLGQQTEATSIPVVIASDQTGSARQTNILRTSASSTVSAGAYSVSFANVHASGNVRITAGNSVPTDLAPGETISFDAGAVNNTLDTISYDASSAEALIIFIS